MSEGWNVRRSGTEDIVAETSDVDVWAEPSGAEVTIEGGHGWDSYTARTTIPWEVLAELMRARGWTCVPPPPPAVVGQHAPREGDDTCPHIHTEPIYHQGSCIGTHCLDCGRSQG